MKKAGLVLALIACLGCSSPALAQSDGLTEAQRAEIAVQVAQMRAENTNGGSPASTAKAVNEWVQVGQGVGAGLASAARELGVVANDFAKTPVGQITIAVIIWKIMGGDLTQLIVGLMWYFSLVPIWLVFYRKLWLPVVEIEYDADGKKKKVKKTPYIQNYHSSDISGYVAAYWVALAVILGVGLPIIFA